MPPRPADPVVGPDGVRTLASVPKALKLRPLLVAPPRRGTKEASAPPIPAVVAVTDA